MVKQRDLVGYGGKPPHPRWPNGARIAVPSRERDAFPLDPVSVPAAGQTSILDMRTGAVLAKLGGGGLVAWSPDGRLLKNEIGETALVWHRRRPEWWWGAFYLWEFWLTAAFAALFAWSVVKDRGALAAAGGGGGENAPA